MWKVSLLVTTYNVKEQAKITLDSIGQQDYPDIEVIIVDGKSQDGTLEVIRDFAEKYGQSGYDSQTAQIWDTAGSLESNGSPSRIMACMTP